MFVTDDTLFDSGVPAHPDGRTKSSLDSSIPELKKKENGMDKYSAAYLAASFLTSRNVDGVAADYLTWIGAQARENAAVPTLMKVARSSKNPTQVLANADAAYSAMATLVPAG